MDGLSVAASIIAIVQLTAVCLKLSKKFVGPSRHSSASLGLISKSLYAFNGTIRNLQTHYEINEDDQARLDALNHLAEPLKRCEEGLKVIRDRLQSASFLGRYVVGEQFDRKLKSTLQDIEEARKLFEIVLHADQQIIISAIERYIRNVADDVRDISTVVNENGKRLRDLDSATRENYEQAKRWRNDVGAKVQAAQDIMVSVHGDIRSAKTDDRLLKIHQWLSAPDPSSNHNAAYKKRQPTTGSWFIEGKQFVDWKAASDSILWLHGIPGCGKTVLCSTIVEEVSKHCRLSLARRMAYFYFDFNDRKKQRQENLVRSLIIQLSSQSNGHCGALHELYSNNLDGKYQPSYDGLIRTLNSILQSCPQTYIILDALDECEDREEVFKFLREVTKFNAVHLLVTSRKERDIEDALDSVSPKRVWIQSSEVSDDIQLYILDKLNNDPRLKRWPESVKNEIFEKLVDGACGMFRWVACQVESLRKCLTVDAVKATIHSLPKTLDDTYDRILLSIGEEYAQDALKILQWLAFSARPLRIEEAAELVAYDPECEPPFDTQRRLTDPRDLLIICSSLVVISPAVIKGFLGREGEIEELKLAHFSVKEYLVSKRIQAGPASKFSILEIPATLTITQTCLAYILQFNKPDFWAAGIYTEYPLARYAARYWTQHARILEGHASGAMLNPFIRELFGPKSNSFLNWIRICDPEQPEHEPAYPNAEAHIASRLYYASLSGFCECVDWLIEGGADANSGGGLLRYALIAASSEGYYRIAKRLVENGADVNAQGGYFGSALQAASARGHRQIVDWLLEHGAYVNTQGGIYGSALHAASIGGYGQTVDLLLEKGADANVLGGYFGTTLQAASARGFDQIVKRLLRSGAEVNARGGKYGNALQAASANGHRQIVELLLDKGACVNAQGGIYGTALIAASAEGHSRTVESLLELGAEVNAPGWHYGNALGAASRRNQSEVIEQLFRNGAEVRTPASPFFIRRLAAGWGQCGQTLARLLPKRYEITDQKRLSDALLQAAAWGGHYGITKQLIEELVDSNTGDIYQNLIAIASGGGHIQIVNLLLQWGSKVNAGSGELGYALVMASALGHYKIAELLLDKGASANAKGMDYGDALTAASSNGHTQIVQLLLQKGANVNSSGGRYGGPLQAAATGNRKDIIELLLKNGANVDALGGGYGNALQAAAAGGYRDIVELLLEKGADVNAKGGKYGNALQAAADQSDLYIIRLLLSTGANVNATGGEHGTTLMAALERPDPQVITLLVTSGANVKAEGGEYGSAIAKASATGDEGIVELLLEHGADANASPGEFGTAMDIALSKGYNGIVRLLLKHGAVQPPAHSKGV